MPLGGRTPFPREVCLPRLLDSRGFKMKGAIQDHLKSKSAGTYQYLTSSQSLALLYWILSRQNPPLKCRCHCRRANSSAPPHLETGGTSPADASQTAKQRSVNEPQSPEWNRVAPKHQTRRRNVLGKRSAKEATAQQDVDPPPGWQAMPSGPRRDSRRSKGAATDTQRKLCDVS